MKKTFLATPAYEHLQQVVEMMRKRFVGNRCGISRKQAIEVFASQKNASL